VIGELVVHAAVLAGIVEAEFAGAVDWYFGLYGIMGVTRFCYTFLLVHAQDVSGSVADVPGRCGVGVIDLGEAETAVVVEVFYFGGILCGSRIYSCDFSADVVFYILVITIHFILTNHLADGVVLVFVHVAGYAGELIFIGFVVVGKIMKRGCVLVVSF